ncbi:TRAP transporter small permease [Plastoroseomonas hellenica]|nr:TRAP transporter small permease subunit [Plastoroseomonas hellenica]
MRAMRGLYRILCGAEAFVAGSFLLLMVVLIFLGGVARMLGMPLNWTTDLATCLFAWGCFLAADVAWRSNSMMSIDVLVDRLPARLRVGIRLLNHALIIAFLLYLIVAGFYLAWVSRIRTFQGMPGVSYSWVTASLPSCALLLLVTTIRHIRAAWRGEQVASRAVDVV